MPSGFICALLNEIPVWNPKGWSIFKNFRIIIALQLLKSFGHIFRFPDQTLPSHVWPRKRNCPMVQFNKMFKCKRMSTRRRRRREDVKVTKNSGHVFEG